MYHTSIKMPSNPVKCEICKERFAAEHYLKTRVRFKHEKNFDLKDSKRHQKITASTQSYQGEQTSFNSDNEQVRKP